MDIGDAIAKFIANLCASIFYGIIRGIGDMIGYIILWIVHKILILVGFAICTSLLLMVMPKINRTIIKSDQPIFGDYASYPFRAEKLDYYSLPCDYQLQLD
jgi:hypothetical protein